jgi:hypothetical protein
VIETWAEAHSTNPNTLSDDDADEIWEWMQGLPPIPLTLKEARANAGRESKRSVQAAAG